MKPIRHLIAIVFLLCGLTARGSERGYYMNFKHLCSTRAVFMV